MLALNPKLQATLLITQLIESAKDAPPPVLKKNHLVKSSPEAVQVYVKVFPVENVLEPPRFPGSGFESSAFEAIPI